MTQGLTTSPATQPVEWRRRFALLALLAITCAIGALMFFQNAAKFSWGDDDHLPIDGQPHEIAVQANERSMLWTYEFYIEPQCQVADANGDPVGLTHVQDNFRRSAGKPGDWVGTWTFTPTTDRVIVSCSGLDDSGTPIKIPVDSAPFSVFGYGGYEGQVAATGVLAFVAMGAGMGSIGVVRRRR